MSKHVVITAMMLFSTWAFAHDSNPKKSCQEFVSSQMAAKQVEMEEFALTLAEWSSLNSLIVVRVADHSPSIGLKIRNLQHLLGAARHESSSHEVDRKLVAFKVQLTQDKQTILDALALGSSKLWMGQENVEMGDPWSSRRSAQHPDRPMKRETLNFGSIPGVDGLDNWPLDFSNGGQ